MLPQQDLSKDKRHQRIDTRPRQHRINLDQMVSECLNLDDFLISMRNLQVFFADLYNLFGFLCLGNRSTTPSTRDRTPSTAASPVTKSPMHYRDATPRQRTLARIVRR
eukprot:s462_g9.t1